MQILTKNDRKKIKSKNYLLALYSCLTIFFVCIILKIIHLIFFSDTPSSDLPEIFFVDILDAIIGAILGIAGIDLIYQKRAERDIENDTAANIISALVSKDRDDTHPRLYELYNKDAVEQAMARSIESYCASEDMAKLFLSYIKKSCRLAKINENYTVTISQEGVDENEEPQVYIEQRLKETRVFQAQDNAHLGLFSFFIFQAGSFIGNNSKLLDEKLKDDKYYMREEFCNPRFVDALVAIDKENISSDEKRDRILELLEYKVDLFNPTTNAYVSPDRISYNYEFVKDAKGLYLGLEIVTPLVPEVISSAEIFYKEENFKRYTALLKFKYMVLPKINTFYVVYSAPTIGSSFDLIFDDMPNISSKSVNYMPFISFAQEKSNDIAYSDVNDGEISLNSSMLSFKTKRAILPRSGISISWNNKNPKEGKDAQ